MVQVPYGTVVVATAGTRANEEADGRAARSARTRDTIVDAYLELVDGGDPRPTARRIAEQAGVSLRSVYVRFEDRDGVAVAAAERQLERIAAIVEPVALDAPLSERLDAFVAQRSRVSEMVAPVRRAAEQEEPFSTELARLLGWARDRARDEVASVFARELSAFDRATRARRLDALDVVAGTTTWEALRRHRGLSPAAASRVMTEMLAALLGTDTPGTSDEED